MYAARGEQGRIWRLDTASGSWAVKELLLPVAEAGAALAVLILALRGWHVALHGRGGYGLRLGVADQSAAQNWICQPDAVADGGEAARSDGSGFRQRPAGIVAIAGQYAHKKLGFINPALYRLEQEHAPGIVDITRGSNTVSFTQGGKTITIRGYQARPGYDLVTGVGTIDAARFVPELARTG